VRTLKGGGGEPSQLFRSPRRVCDKIEKRMRLLKLPFGGGGEKTCHHKNGPKKKNKKKKKTPNKPKRKLRKVARVGVSPVAIKIKETATCNRTTTL